jgi:hypothetical protein
MVASLLKIISTGMQDERLQPPKGQPSIGSLLCVFVKAGRYGTNWARIDFDTKPDFGKIAIARLPVQGELISRIFLVVQMPGLSTEVKSKWAVSTICRASFWLDEFARSQFSKSSPTSSGRCLI